MNVTPTTAAHALVVYLPDTRGVTVSRFGFGNLKIGRDVHTYSRLPGHPAAPALGMPARPDWRYEDVQGTCPGASKECQAICYAARPVTEKGVVYEMWKRNSLVETVPEELPPGCTHLRLHISGDFTSTPYIDGWTALLARAPHVRVWAYTRSWRVAALLPALDALRALPNVQLFASMDSSTVDLPPAGWRIAWIAGDQRLVELGTQTPLTDPVRHRVHATPHGYSFTCPEETSHVPDCRACRYCFDGQRNDVTFLRH